MVLEDFTESLRDFGVEGREVNLKERLRDELIWGSEADVEVEPFLPVDGVEVDEDLRVKGIPRMECQSNFGFVEEGVSERGGLLSSES